MNKSKHRISWLMLVVLLLILPVVPGCNCQGLLPDNESKCILQLTHPAGQSPKVFTSGWVFGAKCIINPGTEDEKDVSDQVKWSGSGNFDPEQGEQSRPTFKGEGENYITLTYENGDESFSNTFRVNAVSPENYAYVGAKAFCPSDSHGCPACPHAVAGPIATGSPNVFVNGQPAARQGDTGTHVEMLCCGPNTFTIVEGDSEVLINGKPAARFGDQTQHCGGTGSIVREVPSKDETTATWDEQYWRDVVAKSRAEDTSMEERDSLYQKIRSERIRLRLVQQFQYDQQPLGWQFLEPGDPEYDDLMKLRDQINETKHRINILDGIAVN